MTRTQRGGVLMVVAIVAVALNLRTAVNALGSLLPEIRLDLGLGTVAAGALNALPTLTFAVVGLFAPTISRLLGIHRAVTLALLLSLIGQLLRVWDLGTTGLFVGTVLVLAGVSITNVLVPGLVRMHFPNQLATLTAVYITVLSIGGTLGAGATVPVQKALGGDWRVGLGVWASLTLLALVPWLIVLVEDARGHRLKVEAAVAVSPKPRPNHLPLRSVFRSKLAWALAALFGMQSGHAYVGLGWLGQVLTDAGIEQVQMGLLLAVISAVTIPLSVLIPLALRRQSRMKPLLFVLASCYLSGYLGLLFAPTSIPWMWTALIGMGGGTFPLVLTLFTIRARTPSGVVALSGFAQCFGYLLASLWPLTFGLLHELGGTWHWSLIFMIATIGPMLIVGLRLVRPRYLEDELAPAAATSA